MRCVQKLSDIAIEIKNFRRVITATNILLVLPTHRIFIEQGYLVVDQILAIDIPIGESPLRTVSVDPKAGTLVDRVIGNVNHLVGLSGPGIVKGAQHLPGFRVEVEHDFSGYKAVASALVGVFHLPTLAHIHAQQAKNTSVRLSGHARITVSGPFEDLR